MQHFFLLQCAKHKNQLNSVVSPPIEKVSATFYLINQSNSFATFEKNVITFDLKRQCVIRSEKNIAEKKKRFEDEKAKLIEFFKDNKALCGASIQTSKTFNDEKAVAKQQLFQITEDK